MIDTLSLKNMLIDMATCGKLTENFTPSDTVESIVNNLPAPSNKRQKLLSQCFEYAEKPIIPEHWTWIRLGNLSSYGDSPIKIQTVDINDDTWVLDLEDIQAGGTLLEKKRFIERKPVGEKTVFKKGQVLYSKLRPYLKKVLVANDDGVSTPELIAFDVYGGINPRYVVYCLLNSFTVKSIDARSYGIKMPRIDAPYMINLPIPIPPISEQEYIVNRIQELFEQLEKLDRLQAQYSKNLFALKSKIIDAAIQGKLTEHLPEDGTGEELFQQIQQEKAAMEKAGKIKKSKPLPSISSEEKPFDIPENWKWVRLDEITMKISSGNTPSGGKKSDVYVDKGFCFFREQNIYNDGIRSAGMVYISEQLLNSRENSTVIAKDILLNITGGSIGRCAIIPDDFTRGSINQHILIIRMVNETMRFYIHSVICSDYVQQYIKKKAVGDKDGFSGGRCKSMPIPLPPLAEQKRIVAKLEELLPLCEE